MKYMSVITNFGCHYECPYCIVTLRRRYRYETMGIRTVARGTEE